MHICDDTNWDGAKSYIVRLYRYFTRCCNHGGIDERIRDGLNTSFKRNFEESYEGL